MPPGVPVERVLGFFERTRCVMRNLITQKTARGLNPIVVGSRRKPLVAFAAMGAAALALGLVAATSQAATITWQAPATVSSSSILDTIPGAYSGASLQQSIYYGSDSAAYTVLTSGGQTVPFTAGSSSYNAPSGTGTGLFYSGHQKLSGSPTSDPTFNNVLENDGWASSSTSSKPQTLQIGGLTSGTNYVIQLFAYDPRPSSAGRTEEFADAVDGSGSNSASFSTASAMSVIGSFTADSTTQSIYALQTTSGVTSWDTTVSAFTLYSVPASVPEPASVGLLALGAFSLLFLRRRGRQA